MQPTQSPPALPRRRTPRADRNSLPPPPLRDRHVLVAVSSFLLFLSSATIVRGRAFRVVRGSRAVVANFRPLSSPAPSFVGSGPPSRKCFRRAPIRSAFPGPAAAAYRALTTRAATVPATATTLLQATMSSDGNIDDGESVAAPASASSRVRIVTYNVLSSKLARPSHFTNSDPAHLDYSNRLPKVLAKLEREMERGFGLDENGDTTSTAPPGGTIFCLQEVCDAYASDLHAFFANKGYHFVAGRYGRAFNGYMGVAIAYPIGAYETVGVKIERLSDERDGGWPRPPKVDDDGSGDGGATATIRSAIRIFRSAATRTIRGAALLLPDGVPRIRSVLGLPPPGKPPVDPWVMSENRHNCLLTVALRERRSDGTSSPQAFCVSTYHMPCAFFAPPVMNVHAEMVVRRVETLARDLVRKDCDGNGHDGSALSPLPYVLAGDFNILPDSAHYRLLVEGALPKSDPTYPPPNHGSEWTVGSSPVISAYATATNDEGGGGEPEFTNYAQTREDDPFVGTLDYIFLSGGGDSERSKPSADWTVRRVKRLTSLKDSGGPFPNADEPSDHLLIAADLELTPAHNGRD